MATSHSEQATHHAGCACHEERRDDTEQRLRIERDALRREVERLERERDEALLVLASEQAGRLADQYDVDLARGEAGYFFERLEVAARNGGTCSGFYAAIKDEGAPSPAVRVLLAARELADAADELGMAFDHYNAEHGSEGSWDAYAPKREQYFAALAAYRAAIEDTADDG